jgi:hypothetical protein
MKPSDDLGSFDDQAWAEFTALVDKLVEVGWVERAALDDALGGLSGRSAGLLFFIAQQAKNSQ